MNRKYFLSINRKTFLLILLFVCLFFYQCSCMFSSQLVSTSYDSPVFVLLIFILTLLGINFNFCTKSKIVNSISILVLFIYIFTLLNLSQSPVSSIKYYFELLLPLLVAVYIQKKCKDEDSIQAVENLSFFLLVGLFIYYITNYNQYSGLMDVNINNASSYNTYSCLYFLPLILCNRNKIYRIAGIVLATITTILSLKRGGIISISMALILYFAMQGSNKYRFFNIKTLCSIVFFFFFFYYILDYYGFTENVIIRFSQLEDSGESSRAMIYSNTIDSIQNSNLFDLLFGKGWNAVLNNSRLGFSAHNDYLEVLFDFGLITLVSLILLWIRLLKFSKFLIGEHSSIAGAFLASLIIFFINTNISHIIFYSNHFTVFALTWSFMSIRAKNKYV